MKQETEFQLYQIAEDQAGYFTLAQTQELGLRRNQIYREVARGKFEKSSRGVYRFRQFPYIRLEEIHATRLRAGKDAIVGFETALYIYDLSDNIPNEIHLILPPTASRRRADIRIHTTKLAPADITTYQGFPITTVARTIVDCAFSYLADEHIELAVYQALYHGMTSVQELKDQANGRSARVQELISRAIKGVAL